MLSNQVKKREIEYAIWIAGVIVGIFAISVLLIAYFTPFSIEMISYDCWIHEKSGLYCPGCGGTRAFFRLLHGDIIASFCYHPLVLYMGILYVAFMLKGIVAILSKGRYSFMKYHITYVYVGIAITVIQFLVKNICLIIFHFAWLS